MKYRISLFLKFEFQIIFTIFSSNLNSQKKPNEYSIYIYDRK